MSEIKKTQEWYDKRLADMIEMRQIGISLETIGLCHDITAKYACTLLCRAGVYAYKRKKTVTEIIPAIPVKVGRWTRLAEVLTNVIKRFKK